MHSQKANGKIRENIQTSQKTDFRFWQIGIRGKVGGGVNVERRYDLRNLQMCCRWRCCRIVNSYSCRSLCRKLLVYEICRTFIYDIMQKFTQYIVSKRLGCVVIVTRARLCNDCYKRLYCVVECAHCDIGPSIMLFIDNNFGGLILKIRINYKSAMSNMLDFTHVVYSRQYTVFIFISLL